jgi:hypothetical protein
VLAVTRFEGLAPTDPPTSDVLLVSYTYLVDGGADHVRSDGCFRW